MATCLRLSAGATVVQASLPSFDSRDIKSISCRYLNGEVANSIYISRRCKAKVGRSRWSLTSSVGGRISVHLVSIDILPIPVF